MTIPTTDPTAIRRYLMGTLPERDADVLESEYFACQESLDVLSEIERDLVGDYLSGRLGPAERALFESHYLASPVHRERLAIELALRRRRWLGRRWSRRALATGAIAATLAACAVGAAWFVQTRSPRGGADLAARGSAPGTGNDGGPAPLQLAEVTMTLPAIMVRGEGQTPTVRLVDGRGNVVFRLERGEIDGQPPFVATVRSLAGAEVWRGPADAAAGPAAQDTVATVTVPAVRLARGDYFLSLGQAGPPAGQTEIQRYFFRVETP